MVSVFLDPQGRLIEFHAVPPAIDTDQGPWAEYDWKPLFTEAGLDYEDFKDKKVASIWVPDVSSDQRQAWRGVFPERRDFPLRIEAATYHGKPVYFRLVGDWTKPEYGPGVRKFFSGTILYTFILLTVVLVVGAPFAWRNWKLGRGDRRGALRVAVFLFGIHFLMWVLFAEHVPHVILETSMLWGGLGLAFHCAICLWVGYLALEPAVRRRWPWRIVSWTRVVAGRFRDPLVGRDILIGGLLGVALVLGQALQNVFPTWLGLPPPLPLDIFVNALTAAPTRIAFFALGAVSLAVTMSLTFFALFFVLGMFLRRTWLAALVLFVILLGLFWQSWWDAEYRWIALVFTSLGTLLAVFVMHRYGLLPLTFGFIFFNMLNDRPITYDFSAWYGPASLCYLLVLVVLAVYAFFIALGGRPLFRAAFFHEE
jgi:serine/threonine-protein kinase